MNEKLCNGCFMEGKTNVFATKSFEEEERVIDPCPDAYEYSLKGQGCLVLHHHMEKRTINLCDRHYEIHEKYKQSNTITHR